MAHTTRVHDDVVDAEISGLDLGGGEHEVTAIDCPEDSNCLGVTMHGEEDGGEFVYLKNETITIWKKASR